MAKNGYLQKSAQIQADSAIRIALKAQDRGVVYSIPTTVIKRASAKMQKAAQELDSTEADQPTAFA